MGDRCLFEKIWDNLPPLSGRVAEWLKAPVLKTGIPETVSGVRIPSLPPFRSSARSAETEQVIVFSGLFPAERWPSG